MEFSRPVALDHFERAPYTKTYEASEAECKAIQERLAIEEIHSFKTDFRITRDPNVPVYYVECVLTADVTLKCSRSNDLFRETIGATVEELFTTDPALAGIDDNETLEDMMEDGDMDGLMAELQKPFMVKDSNIDLGEMATQFLSLCLPDYPVSPDLRDAVDADNQNGDEAAPNADDGGRVFPFADLKAMMEGKK